MDQPTDTDTDISSLAEPTFISICTYLLPRERMALALTSKTLYSKVHPNLPYIALITPWWTSWSVSSYDLDDDMDPDDECWCRGSAALEEELDQLTHIVREYDPDILEVVDIKRSDIESELIAFNRPDRCGDCTSEKHLFDLGAEVPLYDLLGWQYELIDFDDFVEEAEAYECLLEWETADFVWEAREAGSYVRLMDRRCEFGSGFDEDGEGEEYDERWNSCMYALNKLKGSQADQGDDHDDGDDSDGEADPMDVDEGVAVSGGEAATTENDPVTTAVASPNSKDNNSRCFGSERGYFCDFHLRLARLEKGSLSMTADEFNLFLTHYEKRLNDEEKAIVEDYRRRANIPLEWKKPGPMQMALLLE
ncbi:hypothetical protein HK102_003187 [Quaeritorhiza haematococci]|nr:hypothetical protein HK102_003187 [Quaeritorhiza haematococci]